MKNEYKIPAINFAKFVADIEKISRKVVKLGFSPILPQITESIFIKTDKRDELTGKFIEIPALLVTLDAPIAKIAGYRFVATLDHSQEAGTLVRAVPNTGVTIPTSYRDCKPHCDHCGINRYRRDTFLVVNDSDEFKQVGSTCLQSFFGLDPHKFAALATWLATAGQCADASEDYDGESMMGGDHRYINTQTYAEHCAVVCRKSGFISKGYAYERDIIPSCNEAHDNMRPSAALLKTGFKSLPVTQEDKDLATEALAWADAFGEKDDRSDYEHNAMVLARSPWIEYRASGLLCSIVGVYLRNKGLLAERAAKASGKPSNWQGEIKDKVTRQVTVTFHKAIEGGFGTSHLYKFIDADGNQFAWFSSNEIELLKEGVNVALSGTIKKLDEYQGVKTTALTRCKVK